jgi:hypothetical protein
VLIRSRLDPEPSFSFDSGEPISQWRREEIRTLPQELLGQCLLTMRARERQASAIPERPLITTPQEGAYDTAGVSQTSTVHSMFGSDINASCFGERERARQMQILMVMWSRGFVCRLLIVERIFLADLFAFSFYFFEVVEILDERTQPNSYIVHSMKEDPLDQNLHGTVCLYAFYILAGRLHALLTAPSSSTLPPTPRELYHSEARIF